MASLASRAGRDYALTASAYSDLVRLQDTFDVDTNLDVFRVTSNMGIQDDTATSPAQMLRIGDGTTAASTSTNFTRGISIESTDQDVFVGLDTSGRFMMGQPTSGGTSSSWRILVDDATGHGSFGIDNYSPSADAKFSIYSGTDESILDLRSFNTDVSFRMVDASGNDGWIFRHKNTSNRFGIGYDADTTTINETEYFSMVPNDIDAAASGVKVGILNTAPSTLLHVGSSSLAAAATNVMRVEDDAGFQLDFGILSSAPTLKVTGAADMIYNVPTSQEHDFQINGANEFRIGNQFSEFRGQGGKVAHAVGQKGGVTTGSSIDVTFTLTGFTGTTDYISAFVTVSSIQAGTASHGNSWQLSMTKTDSAEADTDAQTLGPDAANDPDVAFGSGTNGATGTVVVTLTNNEAGTAVLSYQIWLVHPRTLTGITYP